jgi:hypothetical protein
MDFGNVWPHSRGRAFLGSRVENPTFGGHERGMLRGRALPRRQSKTIVSEASVGAASAEGQADVSAVL